MTVLSTALSTDLHVLIYLHLDSREWKAMDAELNEIVKLMVHEFFQPEVNNISPKVD